jgi:hypothetical protein
MATAAKIIGNAINHIIIVHHPIKLNWSMISVRPLRIRRGKNRFSRSGSCSNVLDELLVDPVTTVMPPPDFSDDDPAGY